MKYSEVVVVVMSVAMAVMSGAAANLVERRSR